MVSAWWWTRADSHPFHPLLPGAWLGSSGSPALQPTCSSVPEAALSRSPRASLLPDQYTRAGLGVLDLSWVCSAHHSLLCETLSSIDTWDDLTSGIPFTLWKHLLSLLCLLLSHSGSSLGPSAALQMYLPPGLRTWVSTWTRPSQGPRASHILASHPELPPPHLHLPSCCWAPPIPPPHPTRPCPINLILERAFQASLPLHPYHFGLVQPGLSLPCPHNPTVAEGSPGGPSYPSVPTVALGKLSPPQAPCPGGEQAASQQLHQPLVPH